MLWFRQGMCFLPAFLVVWSSSTFIISYIIAIYRRDVDVIFPYISDTGADPPESCIFGLMTFISACTGIFSRTSVSEIFGLCQGRNKDSRDITLATIYAMYKFVGKVSEETRVVNPHLNKAALGTGMLSCLGMCVVATFQETLVPRVHDVGALLFFTSGVVYIVLQTVISYRLYPYGSSLCMSRIRLSIALLAILAFFPTLICAFFVRQSELHRHPEDKDYPFHVASAVSEWVVAFSFIFFFFTYIDDFKLFTLRVKTVYEDE